MSCSACGRSDVSLKKCARCQMVAYCSVDCQRSAWPSHKAACAALAQPASSAASASLDSVSSSSSSSAGGPAFKTVGEAQAAGFRVRPSPNQISSDPQMADLQRQLLSKIVGEQMAAAGGEQAMAKDPAAFKRLMQQRVAQGMVEAGMDPSQVASTLSAADSGPRRRTAPGPAPKNAFTGEEMSRNLGKHEMPFGMPGTFYGPGEEEEDHDGHDHGHGGNGHNHSHGGQHGGHNHSHGGDADGHNHSHGGADGHNHSHGGADGHNHSHGGDGADGHNHSHGGHNHNHNHNHNHGGENGDEVGEHNHGEHSHGEHNHGEHSHGDHNHGGHNHSHGGDGEDGHNHGHNHNHGGHNHSHGGENGEDGGEGHNHSHGGHNHSHGGEDGADGHNHSHGGADGHNHSHGGADGHNHSHGEGGHNHNHNHNHGGADGEDGGEHNHSHAGRKHNHGHGGAGGHNHSHGGDDHGHSHGGDDHGHSHGGNGDDHGHSHGGDDHGHSHGGDGGSGHQHGGDNGAAADGDALNQKFGSKERTTNPMRGNGRVATEESPAAQQAHVYNPPSLTPLVEEEVEAALKQLASTLAVGPATVDTGARQVEQLVYSSVANKRPALPGLAPPSSSFTFIPLTPASTLDVTEIDLAERTSECHMCIIALQPFGTKNPTREDVQMKQALYRNHVMVGRNLEKSFEEKEVLPSNAPMSGAPIEVSQESLAPDCSIEMHSFVTEVPYINPLDKTYSSNAAAVAAAAASATSDAGAAAAATGASLVTAASAATHASQLDAAKIQALQQALALGPSKATMKKAAKAKAKKEAAKAAAAATPASGGLFSSLTSMFTGSSSSSAKKSAEEEAEEAEEEAAAEAEEAALLAADKKGAVDEDEEEESAAAPTSVAAAAGFVSGTSANKKKKKKKTGADGDNAVSSMTVIQVLVRCAPPVSMEQGFEQALQDKDPLKMYRFEFCLPTPPSPTPQAAAAAAQSATADKPPASPVLLAAYQTALDYVLAFLRRTHPVPEPTAHQKANFTVKDQAGNLRPAVMPTRVFPAHLALWVDRVEWTGIPRTPFVAKKLPGQTLDNPENALVPRDAAKVNHNVFFTPANKVVDYQTSKILAVAEQSASTALLAQLWKSNSLKELNLHVFPQGHSTYLYKSFMNIEAECEARRTYYKRGKFRPKKLFQNDRLDIQLQFEPTDEEIAQIEAERERKAKGLPPLDNTPKIQLEEDAVDEEDIRVPIQRFLVL